MDYGTWVTPNYGFQWSLAEIEPDLPGLFAGEQKRYEEGAAEEGGDDAYGEFGGREGGAGEGVADGQEGPAEE